MNDTINHTQELLQSPPRVINIGLEAFGRDLKRQGIEVVDVDWSPPAGGNPELAELLARLGV